MSGRIRKMVALCKPRTKRNVTERGTSGVMPFYVRNETKCVDSDYNFGLTEQQLSDMKKQILPNHRDSTTNTEEIKYCQPTDKIDMTKQLVTHSDFTILPAPRDCIELNNACEKQYTELLRLNPLSNQNYQIYEFSDTDSFDVERNSPDNARSSYGNKSSKKVKVLDSTTIPVVQTSVNSMPINKKGSNWDRSSTSSDDVDNDKDFEIEEATYISSGSTRSTSKVTSRRLRSNARGISEQLKAKKDMTRRMNRCRFCDDDVLSQNFMRHLQRHHGSETEVECILRMKVNSIERRQALISLRKDTNFNLHIAGTTRPYRKSTTGLGTMEHYPCVYCKGLFQKHYLRRHAKVCIRRPSRDVNKSVTKTNHITCSQTLLACATDPSQTISKLNVKVLVFDQMKADDISLEAKKDLLIANFGESYLKRHKRERMAYSCSNRMRELSRLLICYREQVNNVNIGLKDILHPKNFDNVMSAVRTVVGYDPLQKTFKAPSLALHLGTSLKIVCDELAHLVLKQASGFKCKTENEVSCWLKNIKNFKKLVESRWNSEMGSLANKDLQEKRWKKPQLLPLVKDIKTFREQCLMIAEKCSNAFLEQKDTVKDYKLLTNACLALLIMFNRRRIGDVQYLKLDEYNKDQRTDFTDFKNALTEAEKVLTNKYKRILTIGKGSRGVVILVPQVLQEHIKVLLENRGKHIKSENDYVFAVPGSKIPWGKGDVAIRSLTNQMKLENPYAISSNKLRKHIATVMQILSLSKDEIKQFAQFMGHTEKTHREFYELPVDIYQTAKVSKLLLMAEKGTLPVKYKGRSLADIELDANLEYPDENDASDNEKDDSLNEHVPIDSILTQATETVNPIGVETDEILNCSTHENMPSMSSMCEKKKESVTESGVDSGCLQGKKIKAKTCKRKGWTGNELTALKRQFASHIKKKVYPKSQEIHEFLKRNNIERTVVVTKAKIQHLMKCQNK